MHTGAAAMTADLLNPIFTDEDAARAHFEKLRWPEGPVCAHCGSINNSTELQGKSHRKGLYKCRDCAQPFTATIGTVYERSHIPLNKWLLATHLLCSSKKGISAHQLWRMLGFGSYRTAWFMAHRIREAMSVGKVGPLGGEGKTVEGDETYIGRKEGYPKGKAGPGHKNMVMTLVERGGEARSFNVESATRSTIENIMFANIAKETAVMTDEAPHYKGPGAEFASHETVNHGEKEYVRGHVTTNTVEGFYSIFKRGMKGVYQHCSEKHLHRYLSEFDFRYSNRVRLGVDDQDRSVRAVKGAVGKRLMYQGSREA
jgi:transposase-like protein